MSFLAKTDVTESGTFLGSNNQSYTFSATASGTGTGTTGESSKSASIKAADTAILNAQNTALLQVLSNNNTSLQDGSLQTNYTTSSKVYEELPFTSVATTTDGVNYEINQEVTVGSNQFFLIPSNINLHIKKPFTNKGYVLGETIVKKSFSNEKEENFFDSTTVENESDWTNSSGSTITISTGYTYDISGTSTNSGTIDLSGGTLNTYNSFTNETGGYINIYSGYMYTSDTFNNNDGAIIDNTGGIIFSGYSQDANSGTFTNSGTLTMSSTLANLYVYNAFNNAIFAQIFSDYTIFINAGTLTNEEYGYIYNNGTGDTPQSFNVYNNGSFINDGFIVTCGEILCSSGGCYTDNNNQCAGTSCSACSS